MKLLPRQEITALKNIERKKEIDEGAKLAQKIDVLRETAAKEEASLSKFREKTLGLIRGDVMQLSQERNILQIEVDILRKEKRELSEVIKKIQTWQ